MNDLISDGLQVIGVFAIGFAIFIWGFAKGVDFKEEKEKICLESIQERVANLEGEIFGKIKIDG